MENTPKQYTCNKCGASGPEEFWSRGHSQCKACWAKYVREYNHRTGRKVPMEKRADHYGLRRAADDPSKTFVCRGCQLEVPGGERAKGHNRAYCKKCHAKRIREYMAANPEKRRKYFENSRKRIKSDPNKYAQLRDRQNRWDFKERLKKYGISRDRFDAMLIAQCGRCWMCEEPMVGGRTGSANRLAIDHCHRTMAVRGLLCAACNLGLGYLKENEEILARGIEYLKQRRE